MNKKIICTVCPMGCNIDVEMNDKNEIININGNTCKRGYIYAKNECTNPKRTLTTTMLTFDKRIISVKTNEAIDKNLMFECMKVINSSRVITPIRIGDVIIGNILNTGADVVACKNIN